MNTTNYARYWRNSLADAELGLGALTSRDTQAFIETDKSCFEQGRLPSELTQRLFESEPKQTTVVSITYRLRVHHLKSQHGKAHTGLLPAVVSPIICHVQLARDGDLLPCGASVVPRDLLTPLDSFKLTIGSVEALDNFLTKHDVPLMADRDHKSHASDASSQERMQQWQDYLDYCEKLYSTVCRPFLEDADTQTVYLPAECDWLVKNNEVTGAATHIIQLYDSMTSTQPEVPLFTQYVEANRHDRPSCYSAAATVSDRLAHASDQYPLAKAQRDALSHTVLMDDSDILAINGPPGTGKTTFLLSAVASLWVKAALTESDPPVMIAASTNNQAVLNIIDAFERDFSEGCGALSGRWLPDINSYGGYFPARSNEKIAGQHYQTSSFYENLETQEYIKRAELLFLARAEQALPNLDNITLRSVVSALHQQLLAREQQLKEIEQAWQDYSIAKERMYEVLGADPDLTLSDLRSSIDVYQEKNDQLKQDSDEVLAYLAHESVWLTIFSWWPVVRNKRAMKRKLFIQNTLSGVGKEAVQSFSFAEYEQQLDTALQQAERQYQQYQHEYEEKQHYIMIYQQASNTWRALVDNVLGESLPEHPSLEIVDETADTQIRFIMFRLAVHYWEGRWLLACKDLGSQLEPQKKKTGRKSVEPRWRRRMMLTPCIVSTFHSLPNHFTYQFYNDGSFQPNYLYNFIDVLFVDEAGQVSPEVAGASFALAKKSVVIGDVHQIEPVRSLSGAIDMGNLLQANLVTTIEEYEEVEASGRSVVSGSVMHIAQAASRFHAEPKMEPGMFLSEHRRCYDDIIGFCNDLCYQGTLQPKRGPSPSDQTWPAMGYVHIDGKATQSTGGSRKNALEAETIAAWLAEHKQALEACYDAPIHELVGVVTPFSAQAYEVIQACRRHGLSAGRAKGTLTVGTVHALQGAERKLIIFSPVYSRHNDGNFIDNNHSILNVAVSRAKDSFLVFSDMDVISAAPTRTPRGMLAKYLLSDASNELVFTLQQRTDLLNHNTSPQLINNAKQHDEYLLQRLQKITRNIHIVSPWISLKKLESTGLLNALTEAKQRGIDITIYTDEYFNTTINNLLNNGLQKAFKQCCQVLSQHGIRVVVVDGVHSKLIMSDDSHLCIGSFNWFSAARTSQYVNLETSLAYDGDLASEIQVQINHLRERTLYRIDPMSNEYV
ncbi:AAA domain-containing protein [bacterium]|nr:AAA domain-containing protein [bacterium]